MAKSYSPPPRLCDGWNMVDFGTLTPYFSSLPGVPLGVHWGFVDDDGGVNLPDFNRKLRLGEI